MIQEQSEKFPFVKGIRLSRNFGQHNAITAGISKSSGDVIILMDCDLQDDPKHIHLLLEKYKEQIDLCISERNKLGRKVKSLQMQCAELMKSKSNFVSIRSV